MFQLYGSCTKCRVVTGLTKLNWNSVPHCTSNRRNLTKLIIFFHEIHGVCFGCNQLLNSFWRERVFGVQPRDSDPGMHIHKTLRVSQLLYQNRRLVRSEYGYMMSKLFTLFSFVVRSVQLWQPRSTGLLQLSAWCGRQPEDLPLIYTSDIWRAEPSCGRLLVAPFLDNSRKPHVWGVAAYGCHRGAWGCKTFMVWSLQC